MKPRQTDAFRASEITLIHVAKKELALAEDEYRSIMLAVTGHASAAKLDGVGRQKLLDHFKKIGFKVKAKAASTSRPQVGADRMPRMRKIEALLAEAKRPWSYLDPLIKNLKRDRIQFCDCDDLSKIIAALMIDAKRHGRDLG